MHLCDAKHVLGPRHRLALPLFRQAGRPRAGGRIWPSRAEVRVTSGMTRGREHITTLWRASVHRSLLVRLYLDAESLWANMHTRLQLITKTMAQTRQIQQRKHEKQQPSKSIIKNSLALLKKKKSEILKNYC